MLKSVTVGSLQQDTDKTANYDTSIQRCSAMNVRQSMWNILNHETRMLMYHSNDMPTRIGNDLQM
jgi:hypothetical protein